MAKAPQVITCKAAVCWGVGGPVKIEEVEVEPPRPSEIRVKMLCASICRTDILCINGFPTQGLYPRVLGHEGVGVVESLGEEVKDLQVGDTVIPTTLGECGECGSCESGRTNFCQKYPIGATGLMPDGTSRFTVREGNKRTPAYQFLSCATWCEYMVVDANYAVKIDAGSIPPPQASIISCAFTSGYGATWKAAPVTVGSSVAVFGLGPVGLSAVQGARMHGAAKIIGVDKNERRRKIASELGVTHFINSEGLEKPVSEVVKELTDGKGVDACFECSGYAPFMNQAMKAVVQGKGKAVVLGAGKYDSIQLDFVDLLFGGSITGSIFGGVKIKSDLPHLLHKCQNKEFEIDALLTHEVPLCDINKAFEMMKEPDCIKVVVKIS
ncbi:unnamed protein product [Linum tenue]|uniref:Enoyl reductase (ER) domain-containing protein n=1 Tax=Linum tenue TaxID=586396 RepID=A0AAV0JML9_9ROSI|nr:unnamed protein product [Linum tenue]